MSAIALAQSLAGCAGSGGSTTPMSTSPTLPPVTPTNTPPPVTPPTPGLTAADFRTPEYLLSYSLEAVHAAEAYAQGYTGDGVTIGIVDFNFNLNSTEVRYSPDSRGPSAFAQALYKAQTATAPTTDTHGDAVASVAAAVKNNSGIQGLAFNATVLGVDYFSDVNETQSVQGGVLYHISDPWTYITSRGVRIINTSYGYDSSDINPRPPVVHEAYVLQLPVTAIENGALLVTSAGNNAGANPILSNLDTIGDIQSENLTNGPGALIIAGATDQNNQIASYSNRAGTAMNYYMVAPADMITAPWNGALYYLSGTSFAAPLIAGAAALILQKWPMLTAMQVANILFASATDLGAPGVDPIYGHGLLNVNAALQPIGVTTMATTGATPTSNGPAVNMTGLVLGNAFGDARAFRTAISGVMILDSFDRDFHFDASTLAWVRPSAPLATLMQQRFGWQAASLPVGEATGLSFDMRDDPWAGFRTLGGTDASPRPAAVQFFGSGAGLDWSAGTGVDLSDALASNSGTRPFGVSALTRAFAPMLDIDPVAFATARLKLSDATHVSFGVSQANDEGVADHPLESLRQNEPVRAVAMRVDHDDGSSDFALEFGGFTEEGGLLGTLSTGGLQLTNRSATTWTTASAETALDETWSLKAAFSLAETNAAPATGTLIASLGAIISTGFSLGLLGHDLFRADDALSFTLHQPTRAERAPVTLMSGVGRDPVTGDIIMGATQTSLVPSGREIALESGYRVPLGLWSAEADLAYRHDAGHQAGVNETDAMLFLSRSF